jgi:mannose/fructose-specific phosphotransferase system component IIA
MTTLVLLTYGHIGDELVKAAIHIMNMPVEHVQIISVYDQPDTADKLPLQLQQAIEQSGPDRQCLILTDLHGCTHFNVARKFVEPFHVSLISGLNLAMLLRVLNHQDENLLTLSQYAEEGGVMGISTISEAQNDDGSDRIKL